MMSYEEDFYAPLKSGSTVYTIYTYAYNNDSSRHSPAYIPFLYTVMELPVDG